MVNHSCIVAANREAGGVISSRPKQSCRTSSSPSRPLPARTLAVLPRRRRQPSPFSCLLPANACRSTIASLSYGVSSIRALEDEQVGIEGASVWPYDTYIVAFDWFAFMFPIGCQLELSNWNLPAAPTPCRAPQGAPCEKSPPFIL